MAAIDVLEQRLRLRAQPASRHRMAYDREVAVGESDERPWGSYLVLDDETGHKVKRITVRAGQRLSYQRHSRRSEHWFVVTGNGIVVLDGDERAIGPGHAVDVPLGMAHRIYNSGKEDLVFVEVQHGEYFGEDDIVRLSDDYGR